MDRRCSGYAGGVVPRKPEVDQHPQKQRIIKALVRGDTYREITGKYGVTKSALSRYLREHLAQRAAKANAKMEIEDGAGVLEILRQAMVPMQKLLNACDRYLTDPWHPGEYDLGPRAEDVMVTYREAGDDEKRRDRKAKLSELLPLLEDADLIIQHTDWRHADPRELIIKTAGAIAKQLEFAAKLLGLLSGPTGEGDTYNVLVLHPELASMIDEVMGHE